MVVDLPWSDVTCACHSDMVVDVFLPWSDVSVGKDFMARSYISVEEYEDLPGG